MIEHALAIDLLRTADGRAAGITLHVLGEGQTDGVGAVHASAVVLATGGFGQVYSATTNPPVSTGDGLALALRAGAEAADLEFVQFHPTVLWLGPGSRGRQPLISEAVRGEGAVLVDAAGRRFMAGQHPLADLAPRDVVAKAIMREMIASGTDHVYLDGRHLGAAEWAHRFPTILASCREARHRSGHRPDPRRAGRALRQRRRPHRPVSAAPACRACMRAARWPAPASTAPTGWRPTHCSRASSSPSGSRLPSRAACRRLRSPSLPVRQRRCSRRACSTPPSSGRSSS